jgi:hypothetical protein
MGERQSDYCGIAKVRLRLRKRQNQQDKTWL